MMYALLIYNGWPQDQALPGDVEQALLVRHRAMQAEAIGRDELAAVARLALPKQALTVDGPEPHMPVSDGPYMETKEWLAGFYLVECPDEATAVRRARAICPAGGRVEVRPATWHRTGADGDEGDER